MQTKKKRIKWIAVVKVRMKGKGGDADARKVTIGFRLPIMKVKMITLDTLIMLDTPCRHLIEPICLLNSITTL